MFGIKKHAYNEIIKMRFKKINHLSVLTKSYFILSNYFVNKVEIKKDSKPRNFLEKIYSDVFNKVADKFIISQMSLIDTMNAIDDFENPSELDDWRSFLF